MAGIFDTGIFDSGIFDEQGGGSPQTLTPSLFTNPQIFYSPHVQIVLRPALFTNSQTFYSATVTPGRVTLTPSLFTNSQTFYSPIVSGGRLFPALFTNVQTFYAPTVHARYALTPALFTNAKSFKTPTVRSTAHLLPSLFTNSQSFKAPTVAPGRVTLHPALFINSNIFYSPQRNSEIITTRISQHPVNCQMAGNGPTIRDKHRTLEWMPGKAGTKVTTSTAGARRLSKAAPSFTTVTKRGVNLG